MRIYLISFITLLVCAEFGSGHYFECPVERCRIDGPVIRFPFRLKHRHPKRCGYPGFDLYCSQSNETVLELPFAAKTSIIGSTLPDSAKFIVEEINYRHQFISLTMVNGCLPQLNLSASPLRVQYHPTDFTFFNCSSTTTNSSTTENSFPNMFPISCLSSPNYQVYGVDTYDSLYRQYEPFSVLPLFSCSKMFNMSYVTSLLSRDFIRLDWSNPACGHCETKGLYCMPKKKGSINDTVCLIRIPYRENKNKQDESETDLQDNLFIAGVVIGPCLAVLIAIAFHQLFCSERLKKEDQVKIEQFLEEYKALKPARYSYVDLKRITENFSEKLGQGGYGTVYKGKLSNEVFVAVKVLNSSNDNGEEFINEVGTIGRIHHVNVVRLVGYCAEGSRRALVYEFLPNESLEKYLSSGSRSPLLSWEKMQQIALGIAKGIEYLHQGCDQRILHFDIKPHNILLDHNFNPKVSDFGLAKLCSKEDSIVSMTAARGTIGYIAPEVFSRNFGNVSHKSDVYSFGMLLIEMVGGWKNNGARDQDASELHFPEWIYNKLNQGEEIVIEIEREGNTKIFRKLTIIGLWCIQWCPVDRPSMKQVVQMLEAEDTPFMPQNPFGSTNITKTKASVKREMFSSHLEIISE